MPKSILEVYPAISRGYLGPVQYLASFIWSAESLNRGAIPALIGAIAGPTAREISGSLIDIYRYAGDTWFVGNSVRLHYNKQKAIHGDTHLTFAARKGHTPVLRGLLAAGADINANNAAGYNAFNVAMSNNQLATMHLLLDSGAELELDHISYNLLCTLSFNEVIKPRRKKIEATVSPFLNDDVASIVSEYMLGEREQKRMKLD